MRGALKEISKFLIRCIRTFSATSTLTASSISPHEPSSGRCCVPLERERERERERDRERERERAREGGREGERENENNYV